MTHMKGERAAVHASTVLPRSARTGLASEFFPFALSLSKGEWLDAQHNGLSKGERLDAQHNGLSKGERLDAQHNGLSKHELRLFREPELREYRAKLVSLLRE